MGQSIYFTIFRQCFPIQTEIMRGRCGGNAAEGVAENGKSRLERGEGFPLQEYYKQYPQNFFDFIIIDECERGGEFFDKEKTYDSIKEES